MRKKWLPFLISFIGIFIFASCKKNYTEEYYTEIVNPVIPDLTTQVTASVTGFITDENNNALADAQVTAGSSTVTTDNYGYFKCSNIGFAKTAGFIKVSKAGYFTGYRTFLPAAGKETFVRLKLLPQINIGNVAAATGGIAAASNGIKISLPANGVVNAANGTAYSGNVNIAAQWINPADQTETQLTMPGDLRGIDSSGYLKQLVTFGMMAVELTGDAGQKLQVAPGKKATLTFPIPSSLTAAAPNSIALWSFDENKGLWKQETNATKIGSEYIGEVSHFSYWNCDIGLPLVNFSTQLIDTALNPLSNVPVSISIAGQPNSARTAYTDANGEVTGMIPANSTLTMEIIAPCNEKILFKNINTTSSAINLGTITVNLQQYAGSLNGTVNKCNGSPVTDGYVIIAGFGSNSIINVQNGSFFAAGTLCPNTNAALVAFDREASQSSSAQNITLNTGENNIVAPVVACNAAATEFVHIIKDQVVTTNYELPQFMFTGNFDFLNDSTLINVIDLLNSNTIVFQFSFHGPAAAGSYALTNNEYKWTPTFFRFTTPTAVVVSNYGLVGQFITGSITGTAADIATPFDTHTINITFNIKRDL